MPSFSPLLLVSALSAAISLVAVVESQPYLGYVSSFCGKDYDTDPALNARAYLVTGFAVNFGRPTGMPGGFCDSVLYEPKMYAFSWCSTDVSLEDCAACLKAAQYQLLENYCKDLYGGQLTLTGCFLRYERHPFCKRT